MDPIEKSHAIEAIRQAKARYFRGVDTSDGDCVRSILAQDCLLDYRGCCTDPATGQDFLPAMNIIIRGRSNWSADGLAKAGIVSIHHGHNGEVTILGKDTASAIWPMTDRLFMPPGAPFAQMTGYGYYHETYVREDGAWKIATLRIERIRVETG